MLKIFSIFILSVLLAFRPLIPLLDYTINYNYIAKELCENLAQPEILCNGKCYLAKEISKTVDDEKKPESKTFSLKQIDFFNLNSLVETEIKIEDFFREISNFNYQINYSFIFSESLLKPPLV